MISTTCISTNQQTVNLIPALQLGIKKIYLVSSQTAEERGWTSNFRLVCRRRNLELKIIPIEQEIEMSPDKMAEMILRVLPPDEDIYWNISGGKKPMTIGFIHAYQRRGKKKDWVIYTENNPYRIIRYDGFHFLDETPMNFFLELEDILNLYGFTSGNTGKTLDLMTFPKWVAPFSENYLNNPLFQELIARCFSPRAEEARGKEPLVKSIRRILNEHKPHFNSLISSMPEFDNNARGNILKKLNAYCDNIKNKSYIDPVLDACNQFYWNKIKDRIIQGIANELKEPNQFLLQTPIKSHQTEKLLKVLNECGITIRNVEKNFLLENIRLPDKPGFLFEKLVAWEFLNALEKNNLKRFISNTYLGVKTFRLDYDKDNQAVLPEKIQDHESDDEFDLTVVMPWGALQIFEVKTHYGEGGDVLKSLRDSVMSKSGIFGQAILIDHLLEKIKKSNGNFPGFYPSTLISKRNLIRALGMRAWGYDEIEKKLPETMNQ